MSKTFVGYAAIGAFVVLFGSSTTAEAGRFTQFLDGGVDSVVVDNYSAWSNAHAGSKRSTKAVLSVA